jgi:hypothetical protein
MNKTIRAFAYSLTLLITLAACGGGGGGGDTTPITPITPITPTYTKATVKIAIAGTLPPNTNISGLGIAVTLPEGVSLATDNNGDVISGSVTPSGIFTSGIQSPPIYTQASVGNKATLRLGLASNKDAGENQTGEIVTIIFDLASGTVPIASSFELSVPVVVNAENFDIITGLSASVTNVTLQ